MDRAESSNVVFTEIENKNYSIKSLADARNLFAQIIPDSQERDHIAREFIELGGRLAGHTASQERRKEIYQQYFQQILEHVKGENLPGNRQQAIEATLDSMKATVYLNRDERQSKDLPNERHDLPERQEESKLSIPSYRSGSVEHASAVISSFIHNPIEAREQANSLLSEIQRTERYLRQGKGDYNSILSNYIEQPSINIEDHNNNRSNKPSLPEVLINSISYDPLTKIERDADSKRDQFDQLLTHLRESNREMRSSPAAIRAHDAIESVNPTLDDMRSLYEPTDGLTRAEHAGNLNKTNQFARDLYERGASVYGNTLVVPVEAQGRSIPSDELRIGTVEHALETFGRFIDNRKELIEKAQEFVELGQQIHGRTADGDLKLAVFRNYLNEISRKTFDEQELRQDGTVATIRAFGEYRSREEQKEQLDVGADENSCSGNERPRMEAR
jgi:CRISPR/Cas system CSM-associated protein Csm2 small subunit